MKILVDNYEKRIKNFVLKLAQNPIIVKKHKNKKLTSREEYYANNSNKIIDKKGFSFKFYKTEKERIDEYIKEKNSIDNYITKNTKTKKRKSPETKLIQPSMRFKARTDLERVYDVIKTRENLYKDKKIVQNQLDKLGFVSKNVEEYDDDDSENEEEKNNNNNINIVDSDDKNGGGGGNLNEEEKKRKILHNKIIQDRKNMIERRKLFLTLSNNKKSKNQNKNNQIKHLREELHQKLHFKALENLTMFKTSTMNHNLFKVWSKEDINTQRNITFNKNIYYACLSNGFNQSKQNGNRINSYNYRSDKNIIQNKNNSNILNIKDKDKRNTLYSFTKTFDIKNNGLYNNKKIFNNKKNYNIFTNKKILEDLELTKEIVNLNPLLYNYNFNGGKYLNNDKNNLSNNKLNNLKKIAFKSNSDDDSEMYDIMKNMQFDDLKKEENIIIDGKQYRKSDTYKIADKILKKCNWNKNKVKYDGNFGKGKLMFTNGMTLKEFEEKYGILP